MLKRIWTGATVVVAAVALAFMLSVLLIGAGTLIPPVGAVTRTYIDTNAGQINLFGQPLFRFFINGNSHWQFTQGNVAFGAGTLNKVRSVSNTNLTITDADNLVGVTSQNAARGIYLPDATTLTVDSGYLRRFQVLDLSNVASSDNIIIYPYSTQHINGSNSSVTINSTGTTKILDTDGTQWFCH